MLHNFSILPIELQTDIVDMRAAGLSEDFIDRHIGRIFTALEAKTNRVQADVFYIEEHWEARIQAGFDKVSADLRTQSGASNQMLVDIHILVQGQGAVTEALRAEFQAFGETVSERIGGLEERIGGLEERMAGSESDRKALHDQNDRLEHKFDQLEREVRAALQSAMTPERVAELVEMIERHDRVLRRGNGAHEASG